MDRYAAGSGFCHCICGKPSVSEKDAEADGNGCLSISLQYRTVPGRPASPGAILVDFGVHKQILLDLICGRAEPSGLPPVELPAGMKAVEVHCEDRPFDMEVYRDSKGNRYEYGFGMNWNGVIRDSRAARYPKK